MMGVLDKSVPYYKYFEEMAAIPHGSYNEKQYSDYLVTWAKEHGLRHVQDDMGNVVMYKPASAGYEYHPSVLLQGHMDMVCVKAPGSRHDFTKDPLDLYIEDGWLRARDTTLGGDDGVGCAYMLSILESDTIAHPPLECAFTVQEEVGCNGAANLKAEYFSAKRMIGLDDVGGGTSYVTTAGSQVLQLTRKVSWEHGERPAYRLHIHGLLGGHSGVDIDKERGSAIKIAAQTLFALSKEGSVRLADVNIGDAGNVIPSNGTVVFTASMPGEEVFSAVGKWLETFRAQLQWSDPGLQMDLTECSTDKVMSEDDSRELISFVRFLPDGFFHRSMRFEGLTTVSSNLGTWKVDGDTVSFECNSRSSLESYIDMLEEEQQFLCGVFRIQRRETGRVAGFDYIENSPIRAAVDKAFHEVTGRHIEELFVHGGIEAGYLTRLIPNLDVVTIGPLVPDEHTINERLNLKSFDEVWQTLVKTLVAL